MVNTCNFLNLDEVEKYNIVNSFQDINILDFCNQYGIRKLSLEKLLKDGVAVDLALDRCCRSSFVFNRFSYGNRRYDNLKHFADTHHATYEKVYWSYVTGMGLRDFVYASNRK